MEGYIFNIQKFCLHDGPGIRSTVFFKGCNLRCAWCANPESQEVKGQLTLDRSKCVLSGACVQACGSGARMMENGRILIDTAKCTLCGACVQICPAGAIACEGRRTNVQEILDEVMKDRAFYETSGGGVTFSGGDPLMQAEFASKLAKAIRKQGVTVAIETAAAVPEDVFSDFLKNLDYVFMDFKHYDCEKHRMGTGIGNEMVLANMRILRGSGVEYSIRIPVIPGYNDGIEDAQGFAETLASMGIKRVQLLPFHQMGERKYQLLGMDYAYRGVAQLHREDLEEYRKAFERFGVNAEI